MKQIDNIIPNKSDRQRHGVLQHTSSKFYNKCFIGSIFLLGFIAFCLVAASIGSIFISGIDEFFHSFKSEEVLFSIKLSFFTALISTFFCFCFALPIAYGLERITFCGKDFINLVFSIPMTLPPLVSGFALMVLFGNTSFGHMLSNYGIKFIFSVKGIIIAQFFINFPYLLRLLKSTIADINPRLEFVARTLGCSQWQAFYKLVVPLAVNGIMAGVVTTWARAMGEFGASLMLAGATRMKTETLPICLYLNLSTGDLDVAMATGSILILFSLLALIIFELLVKKSIKINI